MLLRRWLPLALAVAAACVHAPPSPPAAQPPALPPPGLDAGPRLPQPPPAEPPDAGPPPAPVDAGVDVEGWLRRLTTEQKVGQLMMVGFGGLEVSEAAVALVKGRHAGGVCLFKRNVASAEQVARLNDALWALLADEVPPFLAVDQEGGNVVRVADGNLVLPGNMVLGATGDAALAYAAGKAQGEDLRRLGFNMNLAPVLDVNVNPRNPVIGIRAFGDDPALVAKLGGPYARGQQDAQVASIAKHFPGHGPVDTDSHLTLPVVKASRKELERHLAPFASAFAEGLDGVMTAHIAVPALGGDDTPATLSPRVLDGVLRHQLGFDGLVLTDELEMHAIDRRYGVGKAAVMAINAGADMVLIPWRPEKKTEVWEALLEAVKSGELSAARLDQAVRRVLTLKARRGVFEKPGPLAERLAHLGEQKALADQVAAAGITLVRAGPNFPLPRTGRYGVVTTEAALGQAVTRRVPGARVLLVPAYPKGPQRSAMLKQVRALAEEVDTVIVGITNVNQVELATLAAQDDTPVVVVVLGLPYFAVQVPRAQTVLLGYSYQPSVSEAAVAALFGEHGTPGKLPVALPGLPRGTGLDPVGQRAGKSRPPGK